MTELSSIRVLYFEDDPDLVRLLTRILARQPGVTLDSVSDGANAVEIVTARRPDLVFLDLHLADCSGEEVLHALQASSSTRDTPIIILSGDSTPGLPERLKAAGAAGFLSKPLNLGAVLSAVKGAVGAGGGAEESS